MAFDGSGQQAVPFGSGFVPGTSVGALSVEVELSISARKLLDSDAFSKSDPMCVVFVQPFGRTWQELARTEVLKNCLNPDFATKIKMNYLFEEQQKLKFKLYDVDSHSSSLEGHDFLGEVDCTLGQIVSVKTFQTKLIRYGVPSGTIIISAEEVGNCQEELELLFAGLKLKKSGFFSLPDPFLTIFRETDNHTKTLIHRTPYIPDTQYPTWSKFCLPMRLLKNAEGKDLDLIIQCLNYNQDGNHKLIGEVRIQTKDLIDGPSTLSLKHPNKPGSKDRGQLKLVETKLQKTYSFLDYIMGGTQINCTFAIDFTASNGDPKAQTSLHYIGANPNYYELALKSVGEIIQEYDSDKQFPVIGFGARLPPDGRVSHEFFVNMQTDSPFCAGIDGVLQAYRNCLYQVQLYGPTNFAPVINHAAKFAAAHPHGNHYFILLILTDGAISDMSHTKEAIIKASTLPLSIIIVGIGHADFSSMNELDSDNSTLNFNGKSAARDIVQFVAFSEFLQKARNDPSTAGYHLAKALLAEVPNQLVSYMKSKSIIPGNQNR